MILQKLIELIISLCVPITTIPYILYYSYIVIKSKLSGKKLQDKVVLITGASSGLGEALAHVFYKVGCRLILASRREKELQRVKEQLLRTHSTVPTHPPVVLPLDLSELNDIPSKVQMALSVHGHIDILINNGGISYRGDILSTNMDVHIKVMLVNYFGQVALTKAVLPCMVERRSGHIVTISSVQGRIVVPFRSAYSAAKHALQAFCDSLRAEVATHNINVTVVSPGYIRTSLSLNAVTGSGENYGVMDNTTSSGYAPEDVAESILKAVLQEENELIMAQPPACIAMFLRTIAPNIYFKIMKHRANKVASKND